MTSTNDGKDVKSNQTSGTKGKTFYIELYKSLEAGLSKDSDLGERTQNLCEAWRRIHSLCAHSATSTHPHLLSWLQRHTARTVLQTEWQDPENKNEHKRLEEAIDDFIKESQSSKDGDPPWKTQLVARGHWFKRILANPWGHPVLRVLLDSKRKESPKDEEILEWLKEERGVMFVTRLRQLASSKDCKDLALELASSILDRVRACSDPPRDDQADEPKEKPRTNNGQTFMDILKAEAGFTVDVMELLTDIEFVLLHKRDNVTRCIELAKQTPLRNGYQLVERLQSRQETSPREKKLWKNAKDVATLIAQVVVARCMVVGVCAGVSRTALYCCARSLARLLGRARLAPAAAALAAPARTARHLHTLALAVDSQSNDDMKPFVCELYVRAITAGMNELERLKLNADKESEARSSEQTLSQWFVQLGAVLTASERMRCECNLTAFSVHPSPAMYEKIKAAPELPPVALDIEPKAEQTTSEFGSWASDSRSQTNFVKTSETLKLKHTQQANVLSVAILNEGETLHLSPELCQDIAVLLSGPRVKTLSWDMDRELLLENCRTYMERTHCGTRALTTELKYLNLDLRQYQHLPEEDEDDSDIYYGIEKGYEHLVEFQEPEEIWQDADDPDRTESANTTDIETEMAMAQSKRKSKKIFISSDEDKDPLSAVAEAKRVLKKKERPHSKERSRAPKSKTKLNLKDPLEIDDLSTEKIADQSNDKIKNEAINRRKDNASDKTEHHSNERMNNRIKDHSTERPKNKSRNNSNHRRKHYKKKDSNSQKNKDNNMQMNTEKDLSNQVIIGQIQKELCTAINKDIITDKKKERKREPKNKDVNKVKKERKRKEKTLVLEHKSSSLSSLIGMRVANIGDRNKPVMSTFTDNDYDSQGKSSIAEGNENDVLFDGLFSMDELKSPDKVLDKTEAPSTVKSSEIHVSNRPVNAFVDKEGIDSYRVQTPAFNSTILAQSKLKTVNDAVKNSITKLIQFRKQKAATESLEQINLSTNHQAYGYQNIKQQVQQQTPLQVQVSDISKVYMSKSYPEQLNVRREVSGNILTNKEFMSSLNKPSNLPGIQFSHSKPSGLKIHTALDNLLQKPSTSKGVKTSMKTTETVNRNVAIPSTNSPAPIFSQNNFNDFLKDLQTSINAGAGDQCSATQPKKLNKPTSNMNQASPKPESKVTQSAKQTLKKPDLALNTFSRLSYYKSNKNEMKTRQYVDFVTEHQAQQLQKRPLSLDLDSVIVQQRQIKVKHLQVSGEATTQKPVENTLKTMKNISCKAQEHPLMSGLLQSSPISIKSMGSHNTQVNKDKPRVTTPVPNKLSSLTEKDQEDIVLLLRQQSKQNLTRPKLETFKEAVPTQPNTSSTLPTCSVTNLPIKKELNSKSITIKNPSVAKSSNNKLTNDQKSATKPIISKTEQTVRKNPNKKENLKKNVVSENKNCQTKKQQEAGKQTDWESVMDALLKHKTPSRGPNALDMALNKDSYLSAYENSLKNQRSTISPSSLKESQSTDTEADGSLDQRSHSSNSLRKPKKDTKEKVCKPASKVHSSTSKLDASKKNATVAPKKLHSDLRKQQFTCPLPQEDDPFISGNIDSDYDLLHELIDDDLRQEIGELLSDDECYTTPGQCLKDPKAFMGLNKTVTPIIHENKKPTTPSVLNTSSTKPNTTPEKKLPCRNVPKSGFDSGTTVQTSGYINVKPVINHTEHPKVHTAVHNINNFLGIPAQSSSGYVNVKPVTNQTEHPKVQTVQSVNNNLRPNITHQLPKSVIVPPKKEQNYMNTATNVDPTFVALPQQTNLQNVVLIGSDLVYQPCVQAPLHTGIKQNTFVTFNTRPNIAVYQTTQFATPLVNPLIIGNAVTSPAVSLGVPTIKKVNSTTKNAQEGNHPPVRKDVTPNEVKKPGTEEMKDVNTSLNHLIQDLIQNEVKKSVNNAKEDVKKSLDRLKQDLIQNECKKPENDAKEVDKNSLDRLTQNRIQNDMKKTENYAKEDVKNALDRLIQNEVNTADLVVKEDIKNLLDHLPHDDFSTKEKNEIISLKNCERKVLVEVQEKQKIIFIQKSSIDSKTIKTHKASSDHNIKQTTDLERLQKKRMAILNRNICHKIDKSPIPLTYSSLKPKKTEVVKVQEKQHHLRSTVAAVNNQSSQMTIKLDSLNNTKIKPFVEPDQINVQEKDAQENSKENENKQLRILLRSSNKVDLKIANPSSMEPALKKTKGRRQVASHSADSKGAPERKTNSVIKKRTSKKSLNKTIKMVMKTRITRQTKKNDIFHSNTEVNEDAVNVVGDTNRVNDTIASVDENLELIDNLMDIEEQIIGSMILKKSSVGVDPDASNGNDNCIVINSEVSNKNPSEDSNNISSSNPTPLDNFIDPVPENNVHENVKNFTVSDNKEPEISKISEIIAYYSDNSNRKCLKGDIVKDCSESQKKFNDELHNTKVIDDTDIQDSTVVDEEDNEMITNIVETNDSKKSTVLNEEIVNTKVIAETDSHKFSEIDEKVPEVIKSLKETNDNTKLTDLNKESIKTKVLNDTDIHETSEVNEKVIEVITNKAKTNDEKSTDRNNQSLKAKVSEEVTKVKVATEIVPKSNEYTETTVKPDITKENHSKTIPQEHNDDEEVICLDDDLKSDQDNIPQDFLDAIRIEDLSTQDPNDPLKRCVRIKLPNGRAFKATVRGQSNVNFESLFGDTALRKVLVNNISSKNRYTLNIKQISTATRSQPDKILETRIQKISLQTPKRPAICHSLETINLLSDDEDESFEYFNTEFGKYNVPTMKKNVHEMHQRMFDKKSVVKLLRDLLPQTHTTSKINDGKEPDFETLLPDDPTTKCVPEPPPASFVTKAIHEVTSKGSNIQYESYDSEVIELDDSSNDDPKYDNNLAKNNESDDRVKTCEEKRKSLKNLVLQDLGIGKVGDTSTNISIDDNLTDMTSPSTLTNEREDILVPNFLTKLDQDNFEELIVPDTLAEENITKLPFSPKNEKTTVLEKYPTSFASNNCFVKLTKCDNILEKYNSYKLIKGCSIKLVRLDEIPAISADEDPTSVNVVETVDSLTNFEFENCYEEVGIVPQLLCRSDSFSILNDFHPVQQPKLIEDHSRSTSPVMDAYDTIAAICNRRTENQCNKYEKWRCVTDWFLSKPLIHLQFEKYTSDTRNLTSNTVFHQPAVLKVEVPNLVTILTEYFQDKHIIDRYVSASYKNSAKNLKRKSSENISEIYRTINKSRKTNTRRRLNVSVNEVLEHPSEPTNKITSIYADQETDTDMSFDEKYTNRSLSSEHYNTEVLRRQDVVTEVLNQRTDEKDVIVNKTMNASSFQYMDGVITTTKNISPVENRSKGNIETSDLMDSNTTFEIENPVPSVAVNECHNSNDCEMIIETNHAFLSFDRKENEKARSEIVATEDHESNDYTTDAELEIPYSIISKNNENVELSIEQNEDTDMNTLSELSMNKNNIEQSDVCDQMELEESEDTFSIPKNDNIKEIEKMIELPTELTNHNEDRSLDLKQHKTSGLDSLVTNDDSKSTINVQLITITTESWSKNISTVHNSDIETINEISKDDESESQQNSSKQTEKQNDTIIQGNDKAPETKIKITTNDKNNSRIKNNNGYLQVGIEYLKNNNSEGTQDTDFNSAFICVNPDDTIQEEHVTGIGLNDQDGDQSKTIVEFALADVERVENVRSPVSKIQETDPETLGTINGNLKSSSIVSKKEEKECISFEISNDVSSTNIEKVFESSVEGLKTSDISYQEKTKMVNIFDHTYTLVENRTDSCTVEINTASEITEPCYGIYIETVNSQNSNDNSLQEIVEDIVDVNDVYVYSDTILEEDIEDKGAHFESQRNVDCKIIPLSKEDICENHIFSRKLNAKKHYTRAVNSNIDENLNEVLGIASTNENKNINKNLNNDLCENLNEAVSITNSNDHGTEECDSNKKDLSTQSAMKITSTTDAYVFIKNTPSDLVEDIIEIRNNDELEQELTRIALDNTISDDKGKQIFIINTDNSEFDEVKVCCIQQSELQKLREIDNSNVNTIKYKRNTVKSSNTLLDGDDDFSQSSDNIPHITQEMDECGNVKDVDIKLNVPTVTYSRKTKMYGLECKDLFNDKKTQKSLKRKSDMADTKTPEKKYRKGKNIDTPKLTATAIEKNAYSKEFKRLFDYCSSIKFSYSVPFHKDNIDVDSFLKSWPIGGICHAQIDSQMDKNLFTDSDENAVLRDPLHQTLAEEIETTYSETNSSSCAIETNFQMGFGEGSDRVIQNSKKYGGIKFSAATLSDVKHTQPLLQSENDNDCNIVREFINFETTKHEIETLQKYYKCIQLKDKVQSFFRRTMVELNNDWITENKKIDDKHCCEYSNDNFTFPFGLNRPDFIKPPPVEVVVQVVQVGQLPVSATAPNPVTCDPRVTQVSDASPSQCSVENSLNDDPQSAIKTEYTELTTADIRLPLQDYVQHHTQLPTEHQNSSNVIMHPDFIIEEIKEEIKEEIIEEPETNDENNDSFDTIRPNYQLSSSDNCFMDDIDYTYEGVAPPHHITPTLVEATMEIICNSTTNEQTPGAHLEQYQPEQLAHKTQHIKVLQENPQAIHQRNEDRMDSVVNHNDQLQSMLHNTQTQVSKQQSLVLQRNQHAQESQQMQFEQVSEQIQKEHNEQHNFLDENTHLSRQEQIPQQKIELQIIQSNEQAQSTQLNHPPHNTQQTQQVHIVQQNQQVHTVQNNQQLHTVQQNQLVHTVQQNQQVRTVQNNQQLHTVQQNQQVHTVQQNQQVRTVQQNQQLHTVQQNQQLHTVQQNQQLHTVQQNQQLHTVQQDQQVNAVQQNQQVHTVQQNQQLHTVQQNQQLHTVQQNQQVHAMQQNQQVHPVQQNPQVHTVQQNPQVHTGQQNQQVNTVQPNQQVHIVQQNQQLQDVHQNHQDHMQQTQIAQHNQQSNITHQALTSPQTSQEHITSQSLQGQHLPQNRQGCLSQSPPHTQVSQHQQNYQKHNGTPEKTDQIAHAMNAAGITTSSENLANTRAHALVNILSQKLRQSTVAGSPSANTYPKTTQINAMALQQALAQILPPPLNQTNVIENNQQSSSNNNPQVLHIVQGKNASGNQITLVDNSQPSVINTSNATPVLHIVQNKNNTSIPTSNAAPAPQANSFSGLSLVDTGLQQGNQLLHIVNTANQKGSATGQLLRKVNLLTNIANVQGPNEQKMVQFVCKSADGKSIQLNSPHPRGMVLRLQPVESPSLHMTQSKSTESQDLSPATSTSNNIQNKETGASQNEIKSRSVYEENYAKFIQSSNKTTVPEKATSLPKFGQAFGKQVFQDGTQKVDISNSNSHLQSTSENPDCQPNDNAINLDHIGQISSPPLLLRKSPQTSQTGPNLVQQLKQTIAPVNMSMHGGVIYTRQIPVNICGGQTINLITVPSTDLIDESASKHQNNQDGIEPSIIKIVPQTSTSSSETSEENNSHIGSSNDSTHTPQSQPVLTQMRIKLPMLSKTPQMVNGTRLVRPSFFQIQRNVIGGANQPVYQQLVLTAAPPLGQQTIRLPQTQTNRQVKIPSENQSSSESQMSSSTLEQLREFDLVLEQVKERSTGTATTQSNPSPSSSSSFSKLQTPSTDTTDSSTAVSSTPTETEQPVHYSVGHTQQVNVTYINKKNPPTAPSTSTFVRSPDSSGIVESPASSTQQIPRTVTSDSATADSSSSQANTSQSSSQNTSRAAQQSKPPKPKPKPRPKAASNPPNTLKLPPAPPKTSSQKPAEDEQTTQRILYILAEYKEQVENSPDKDKPAPRRRAHLTMNSGGTSKRKKSSSGSRRSGPDMSPCHGEDTCRTMGSEDSSCGTSQGDCNESGVESHSPQESPRKVVRKLTFEQETAAPVTQPRPQPQRNVIVADGQTITVARGTAGKPATAVLMPANYILPVSMVKGGQQIAIVTNRGPKLLTVGGGEGGATNTLLLQRLIGPAGLKPVLARPGIRHVRLPTSALHNLQTFNLAAATTVQPPDSTASPAPAPTPPELVDTRATSSPWRTERDSRDSKPDRGSSPEGSEPWNLPPTDYCYEETVRSEHLDRTVLDPIPDRYSPDMEAQRIFDKMFDVDSKKSYMVDSHDDSPRCGYDIDASDCDDKAYHQVVHRKDGSSHRQHRLTHVSAAALRHKYAILEHELRLQKSLSEECEDLGVDSPSASELFPEAELLFAASPAHDHTQDHLHHSHTPQPLLSQSGIPQPDLDDQIATDQLIPRADHLHDDRDLGLGLEDVGIVTVSEDGLQATIQLDQEEFARSHPNTTFHSDEGEVQQSFTLSGLRSRHISTILHSNRSQGTVLMTTPQTTVISQATAESSGVHHNAIKYTDIDNMINSLPSTHNNNINLSSVLVKDDGLSRFDSLLNDSRESPSSNTASAIVHSSGHTTQVIRRVCYDERRGEAGGEAGDDAGGDAGSSPERHAELFWDAHSGRADLSSDSDKCCKSPTDDASTDSSAGAGAGAHLRLDSVIKEARGPLRTYPAPRSLGGKTAPGGPRRASARPLVKRGTCLCCVGSAPPRAKRPRPRRAALDFAAAN